MLCIQLNPIGCIDYSKDFNWKKNPETVNVLKLLRGTFFSYRNRKHNETAKNYEECLGLFFNRLIRKGFFVLKISSSLFSETERK